MKKAYSLLELIITLFLTSILIISITKSVKNLYVTYNINSHTKLIYLELDNIKLQIQNIISNNIISSISSKKIVFYKVDTDNLNDKNYYEIIDTNQSTKNILFAPNSTFNNVMSRLITFDKSNLFKIKEFQNQKIFLDTNLEKIPSNYWLIEKISSIYLDKNNLYLDDKLILDDIEEFNLSNQKDYINIEICKNKICKKWSLIK